MADPDLRLLCTLARIPALDAASLIAACTALGDLTALLRASPATLRAAGVAPAAAARLAARLAAPLRRELDQDLAIAHRHSLQLLAATDPRYPSQLLAAIPTAPAVLWVQGDPQALSAPQIAIVGARRCTASGAMTARQFAAWFARAGLVVTSGLARGIDAASHAGTLDAPGQTVAVCAHGLDLTYPAEHGPLAQRIAAQGALVSEFPPGTAPRRAHFPQRNRLIAGLALGTVVVEAAMKSGSLSTASWAADQGREVFAVPGSVHSPVSAGCHRLIRDGAKLVETPEEVLAELRLPLINQSLENRSSQAGQRAIERPRLDKPLEILLDAVGFGPTGVDELVIRTGLPGESVASMLLILELEGLIAAEAGGRYSRTPAI